LKEKKIKEKIVDYTRFAYTLMSLSVFFYLGVIIPKDGTSNIQIIVYMSMTIAFLLGAFFFFKRAIKYKRLLQDEK
jgi:uncharacterized membrane protein